MCENYAAYPKICMYLHICRVPEISGNFTVLASRYCLLDIFGDMQIKAVLCYLVFQWMQFLHYIVYI